MRKVKFLPVDAKRTMDISDEKGFVLGWLHKVEVQVHEGRGAFYGLIEDKNGYFHLAHYKNIQFIEPFEDEVQEVHKAIEQLNSMCHTYKGVKYWKTPLGYESEIGEGVYFKTMKDIKSAINRVINL